MLRSKIFTKLKKQPTLDLEKMNINTTMTSKLSELSYNYPKTYNNEIIPVSGKKIIDSRIEFIYDPNLITNPTIKFIIYGYVDLTNGRNVLKGQIVELKHLHAWANFNGLTNINNEMITCLVIPSQNKIILETNTKMWLSSIEIFENIYQSDWSDVEWDNIDNFPTPTPPPITPIWSTSTNSNNFDILI